MTDENEIPPELKNDIQLAFDLFKNENNKINKLKLRTLLFSFVMYKNSASDINSYIETQTEPDQEFFSFSEVCDMVNNKLELAKEKEAEELIYYVTNKKGHDYLTGYELSEAFKNYEINVSDKEIKEMFKYMREPKSDDEEHEEVHEHDAEHTDGEHDLDPKHNEKQKEKALKALKISKEQFIKFYTEKK